MNYLVIVFTSALGLAATVAAAGASQHDSNYSQSPVWNRSVVHEDAGIQRWTPAGKVLTQKELRRSTLSADELLSSGKEIFVTTGKVMSQKEQSRSGHGTGQEVPVTNYSVR